MNKIKPTSAIRSLEIGQTVEAPISQKNSIRAIIQTNKELKLGLWTTRKSGELLIIERINLPLTDEELKSIEEKIDSILEGNKNDVVAIDNHVGKIGFFGTVSLYFKETKDDGTRDTAPFDLCELESWRFSGTAMVFDEKYITIITRQKIRI